ncbi:MAG: nuclear transport factor 2 family protein [Lachnospiraceae bacterium]|nr:nuclear transport factor 2 family protein [Lachnospiraceae bacterium]
MNIKEYEIYMWEAARKQDAQAFLEVVSKDAVMVCGGFRCSGAEYADIIKEFDLTEYEIKGFEIVLETDYVCQVHYIISTVVANERDKDLEGKFHITSTWKRTDDKWKLVFNMDSRLGD